MKIVNFQHILYSFIVTASVVTLMNSCIEPPLHLPSDDKRVEITHIDADIQTIWNVKTQIGTDIAYKWDSIDVKQEGDFAYQLPKSYEVRRYFKGINPDAPYSECTEDGFTTYSNKFSRNFEYGYYDLMMWSNIESVDGKQNVIIREDSDKVTATTAKTRGGLYNMPEVFYSTSIPNVYISRDVNDYDYYDEENNVYVKRINARLSPLVYMYLIQIELKNNDGRIVGASSNNAVSNLATTTQVNTGHTGNESGMVAFHTRMKDDVIGGKLTTFGLCDMDGYNTDSTSIYKGHHDGKNYLYADLTFANGKTKTCKIDITDQLKSHCHGGVITAVIDCDKIEVPEGDVSIPFLPTVKDYDEVTWEIHIDNE